MRFPRARCLIFAVSCVLGVGAAFGQGPPDMGWLGVSISEVTEDLAERLASVFGPAAGTGVQIVEVLKDGPAEQARLARGDVIVRLDAQPIWDVRQLQRLVRAQRVEARVVLTVLRGTSRMTVPVVVGAMPLAARGQLAGERFGFLVREAEETAAGRPPAPTRVFIAFVDPDSPAARAGLQPQDAVLRVNDEPVRDLEGFAKALWRTTEAPVLIVERRGAPAPVVVKLELPR